MSNICIGNMKNKNIKITKKNFKSLNNAYKLFTEGLNSIFQRNQEIALIRH